MAKRPLPGKCVHCLKDPVERNWDHVFPASWYPKSAKQDLYKWQIPSCISCNSEYGKLESDFLVRVALCLDPHDPASSSVVETALRSMRASAGRDPRDALLRAARGRKIIGETLQGAAIPDHGVFPGMEEKWGRPIEEQVAILIPAESFRRIAEKIVRGIFFIQERKVIESPYEIDFFALHENAAEPMKQVLNKFGTTYAQEPGIVVRRAVAPEDNISSLFDIEFWRQMKLYATITKTK
jgi:hypothetical protein